MDSAEIACTLCQGKKNTKVFLQQNSQIFKCQKCGLVFRHPQPSRQEIQEFYDQSRHLENQYFANLKKNYDSNNPAVLLYKKELQKIEKFIKQGKVLDIGCAYGVFLDVARSKGWKPYGVEISKKSSAYARKNFDLDVFTGTLEEAQFKNSFFRLVTMWDVVEHLVDPSETLKEIYRVLEKNGLLLILTINVDSLIAKLANTNKQTKDFLYDIQHNFFFSPKTLRATLKKTGFKDIKILDTAGAQIKRWQSRKIPFVFELGVNFLDILAKPLGQEYRQIVVAQK